MVRLSMSERDGRAKGLSEGGPRCPLRTQLASLGRATARSCFPMSWLSSALVILRYELAICASLEQLLPPRKCARAALSRTPSCPFSPAARSRPSMGALSPGQAWTKTTGLGPGRFQLALANDVDTLKTRLYGEPSPSGSRTVPHHRLNQYV